MLEFLMKEKRDIFTLLYEEGDGRAKKILGRLETIDEELDKDGIILVKCSDENVEETYGLGYLPRLVYFEGGVPEPFVGKIDKYLIIFGCQGSLNFKDFRYISRNHWNSLI